VTDTGSAPRLDPLLYLHFLNRELLRSLGRPLSGRRAGNAVLLAEIISDRLLFSSLAFLWESTLLNGRYRDSITAMQARGDLQLVSEFVSVDEFVASNQRLYAHDRARYPMYFGAIPADLLALSPSVQKTVSTTADLEQNLQNFVSGDPVLLAKVPSVDGRHLWNSRGILETGLAGREGRAITMSLFGLDSIRTGRQIGRLLSLLHLSHYLDFTHADILTGFPGLEYFDILGSAFPRFDMRIAEAVLSSIGLDVEKRLQWSTYLIAERGSQTHLAFLDAYSRIVLGAHSTVTCRLTSDSRAVVTSEVVKFINAGRATDANVHGGRYDVCLAGLHGLLLQLGRSSRVFMEQDERRRSLGYVTTARLLVMVATAIERDAIVAAVRELAPRQTVRRSFAGAHTVFSLGVIADTELLLAQSEMGTESVGGMTLTAADLVDSLVPDYLVCVGIAYGLRPDKQQVGDVMVSTQLKLWDPKKVMDSSVGEAIIWRGDKVLASVLLLDRCRSATLDWHDCTIHFGLLLTANTLVNATRLVQALRASEPDAIGGEMEGAGVYIVGAARKLDWIVIKGISDWGAHKEDDGQGAAARNAARFLLHVVRCGGLSLRLARRMTGRDFV
jgi:nucleoside phosphorylase